MVKRIILFHSLSQNFYILWYKFSLCHLLPIYSILQVLISELGSKFVNGKYTYGALQYTSVSIYVISEFIIVIYFYKTIFKGFNRCHLIPLKLKIHVENIPEDFLGLIVMLWHRHKKKLSKKSTAIDKKSVTCLRSIQWS